MFLGPEAKIRGRVRVKWGGNVQVRKSIIKSTNMSPMSVVLRSKLEIGSGSKRKPGKSRRKMLENKMLKNNDIEDLAKKTPYNNPGVTRVTSPSPPRVGGRGRIDAGRLDKIKDGGSINCL